MRASESTARARATACSSVAPVVVIPWPRSTHTGRSPIAARISAASSSVLISTERAKTGMPSAASRAAGMLYAPTSGTSGTPARSAAITAGGWAWTTARTLGSSR